jgi:hypothetical protein
LVCETEVIVFLAIKKDDSKAIFYRKELALSEEESLA